MEIKIVINKCQDCQHFTHTGQLTKGGAKPVCHHQIIVDEKGTNCFKRIIPYTMEYWDLYKRKFAVAKGIPSWCPLKRGYKYQ